MIPLKLKIKGLYSYQNQQEIDFTRLLDAELFGIFGPTGSGKSTILDAIFLSLYGKVDRLGGQGGGSDNYNQMNLKSNELYIEFEFLDIEGKTYKFTTRGKRNQKNFEKVSTYSRAYFVKEKGSWMPIDKPNIAEIIGLTYDNFQRTVIIPQGKFRDFIQLKNNERQKMMTDIFGLQKFDLAGQTKSLIYKNRIELERTKSNLSLYHLVDQEAIDQKKKQQQELRDKKIEWEKKLTSIKAQLNKLEILKSQLEKKRKLENQLDMLLSQKEGIDNRDQVLQRYILCLDKFASKNTEHQNLGQRIIDLEKSLSSMKEDLQKGNLELEGNKKGLIMAEKTYQNRESLKLKAGEYEKMIELISVHKIIADRQEKLEKAKQEIQTKESEEKQAQHETSLHKQQKIKLKNDGIKLDELREVEKWFTAREKIWNKKLLNQQKQEETQRKIDLAKTQKKEILNNTSVDIRQHHLPVEKIIQLLSEDQANLQEKLHKLEKEKQLILVDAELRKISEDLNEGDPCPLCGSTHHPNPVHLEAKNIDTRKVDRSINDTQQTLNVIINSLPVLRNLEVDSRKIAKELKVQAEEARDIESELAIHRTQFVWENFSIDKPEMIQEVDLAYKNQQQEIDQIDLKLSSLEENISKIRSTLELYRNRKAAIQQELAGEEQKFKLISKGFKFIDYDSERDKNQQQLIEEKQKYLLQYEEIGKNYQLLLQQVNEQDSQVNQLKGKISAEEQQLKEAGKRLAKLNQSLLPEIQEAGFQSLAEVKEILDSTLHIDREKDEIRLFRDSLKECQTSLKDLKEDIGDQQFDESKFLTQKKTELELTDQLDELKQEIGILSEKIEQLEKDLLKKKELLSQLDNQEKRADNLKIMEGLFKARGFVKYVSTVYLENLCAAANIRFNKLTSNALSLEVDEENNFHVRDMLNEGKRRSIKTLSGGQTFQAALCLALALSDQVQQQVKAKQNFFFLDEGFGSQDKQSLRVIFQTLKSLRKENRVVGVISHVEELQEEIDTYLQIKQHPERGSSITPSWIL